jgi:hypothetical protein
MFRKQAEECREQAAKAFNPLAVARALLHFSYSPPRARGGPYQLQKSLSNIDGIVPAANFDNKRATYRS